jgi:hypothetical protein
MWIVIPTIWQAISLDVLVLFSAISLYWNRNESRINDLPATGFKALVSKVPLKLLEELFDHISLT